MGVIIKNGVTIGDHSFINMGAIIIDDVDDNKTIAGFYGMENHKWNRFSVELSKGYRLSKTD